MAGRFTKKRERKTGRKDRKTKRSSAVAVVEKNQPPKKEKKKKNLLQQSEKATNVIRDSSFLGTKDRRVKWYVSVNPEAG